MNHYITEIQRISKMCYANQGQLDTVIGVKNYIDNHFDSKLNLNLLSIAKSTSKFHLLRLFKKYYGLTPRQYMIDKRIEKAKEFLTDGLSVKETCYSVGFESLSSFTTLYKKKTGNSPAAFRKEQLSRKKNS